MTQLGQHNLLLFMGVKRSQVSYVHHSQLEKTSITTLDTSRLFRGIIIIRRRKRQNMLNIAVA